MKRFIHIAGIVLAAAAFTIGELSQQTHWAWAGGAIALLTNIRTAIVGTNTGVA